MPVISYQLYTSRDGGTPAQTLAMLKAAGYDQVEGFGPYFEDPAATRALLDAAGIPMTSGHFALDWCENDPAAVIAAAKTIGIDKVYAPYLGEGERPSDRAAWEAFAAKLAETAKPIMDAGLTFGWHNHDFELVDLGGGATPEDLIANAAPDMAIELDLGWVKVAGHDCVEWINKFGSKITSLHIKDRAPEGENADQDGWSTVGQGVMDWSAILGAAKAQGITHLVVENDHPVDDVAFARDSIAYLKTLPEVSA